MLLILIWSIKKKHPPRFKRLFCVWCSIFPFFCTFFSLNAAFKLYSECWVRQFAFGGVGFLWWVHNFSPIVLPELTTQIPSLIFQVEKKIIVIVPPQFSFHTLKILSKYRPHYLVALFFCFSFFSFSNSSFYSSSFLCSSSTIFLFLVLDLSEPSSLVGPPLEIRYLFGFILNLANSGGRLAIWVVFIPL